LQRFTVNQENRKKIKDRRPMSQILNIFTYSLDHILSLGAFGPMMGDWLFRRVKESIEQGA
jgi:hypothetical protein